MRPDDPGSEISAPQAWKHLLQPGGSKILKTIRYAVRGSVERLTKKLFLSAYEASDDAYWRLHAPQYEWRSLGGIIEYTPNLLAKHKEPGDPVYLIAIRAAPNTYLDRLTIKVKAKKSGVFHQQEITQNQLCDTPVRKALAAIPLKPKASENSSWQKLGDLYIKLVEAVDSNGVDLVKHRKIADIFPSTSKGPVPHSPVERWGQYWIVDEINVEKENIKARYYQEFVRSARNLGRQLTIRRAAYRLLASRLGLTLIFWSQNLGNAEGIRASIAQAKANDRSIPGKKDTTTARNSAYPVAPTEAGS